MPADPHHEDVQRWTAWRDAARRPAIVNALAALYQQMDAAVADFGPTCWASGKCCKFDSYGHRLYVTGLEITWFLDRLAVRPSDADASPTTAAGLSLPQLTPDPQPRTTDPAPPAAIADACRYQVAGQCSVHAIRPLGCRIYFCQEGTDDWQHQTYEAFQQRLIRLHQEHHIDYRYMEWRAGLIEAERVFQGSI